MRIVRLWAVTCGTVCVLGSSILAASDWPLYRGPDQTGISTETISLPWPATGPKALWRVPMNTGFSSFAVAGGKAFTQVVRDIHGKPREICLALDAKTGKELWLADVAVGQGYQGGGDGDGPRSTPTINDGMVYVNTPDLVVHCLDIQTGKVAWKVDLISEYKGRNIGWRNAASPVIDGGLLFMGGGGRGQTALAFDKKTGKNIWKGLEETITHSTPTVATILGQRQVIFFMKSGLVSVAAETGKALWRYPFLFATSTAISPVVSGDIVYCSAGYGVGTGACKIAKKGDGFEAKEIWRSPGNEPVANHWSTPVAKDGYVYGMYGFKRFHKGPMKCVELATGKVMWEHSGFGQGNVTLVGDKLLALSDTAELVVAEATPSAYKEVGRFKALKGKCWSTPAFSDGRIYVRSTTEAACFDSSGKP